MRGQEQRKRKDQLRGRCYTEKERDRESCEEEGSREREGQ
jgi:hypothetical protein